MIGSRIAVIIEEMGQSYQSTILSGINQGARDFGLNIAAFTSFSGDMDNPRHDMGEFNIFRLSDFKDFDGEGHAVTVGEGVTGIVATLVARKLPARL